MTPTAKQVKDTRLKAGLTQAQASGMVGLGARTRWAEYESGRRRMPAAKWDLFNWTLRNIK